MTDRDSLFGLTRRGFLLASSLAVSGVKLPASTPVCSLTPEGETGPYYLDAATLRRDVTEGKPGVPVRLRVALVNAKTCSPLENAALDIWQCDASGAYSGFGASEATRYLRGVQVSGKEGFAEFETVYPGWYFGRAIHIHLKVHTGDHIAHTGQLYFPEEVSEEVAKLEPYAKRAQVHRMLQSEDRIFTSQHGSECLVSLSRLEKRSNAGGFLATATVAVDPEAAPAPVGFGPGRGRRR